MKVGNKIRQLRESKNMSQENMAELLQMSVTGYGKIERDEVSINLERLEAIANTLNSTPEELISNNQQVFNNYGTDQKNFLHSTIHEYSTKLEKLQADNAKLYEDKIKLLEEKVATLEKGQNQLKNEN